MKLSKILCVSTLVLLVACSPEFNYEVTPSDSLELERSTVKFAASESSASIEVEASGKVVVAADTSAKWLTAQFADNLVSISAEANPEIYERSGFVTVSCGNASSEIKVIQSGLDILFTASAETLEFGYTASAKSIEITANLKWSVIPNVDWITPSVYEGDRNATISVDVTDNISLKGRIGLLDFYCDEERIGRVVINQAPVVPELTISASEISRDSNSFEETITVSANWPWNVYTSKADSIWISIESLSRGEDGLIPAGTGYPVKVSASETIPSRDGELVFVTGNTKYTVPVHQEGAPTKLELTKTSFAFESAASSDKFTLTTNNVWEITDVPAWVTLSSTNGEAGTFEININVLKREGAARSATLKAIAGSETVPITVSQAPGAYVVKLLFCPFVDENDPSKGFGNFSLPFTEKIETSGAKAYNLGPVQRKLKSDPDIIFEIYSSHGQFTSNTLSGFRIRDTFNKEATSWPFYYNHDPNEKDAGLWQPSVQFGVNPDNKIIRKVTADGTTIIGDEDFGYVKFPAIEGLKLVKMVCWSSSGTGEIGKVKTCLTTDVSVSNEDAWNKKVTDFISPKKAEETVYEIANPQYNTPYYLFITTNGTMISFYNFILYYEL